MDYAKAFSFVFDDPRWKEKIAIGTGLVLVSMLLSVVIIGVLGYLILAGYSIRLLKNVRDGREFPLPEWDDWGGDFVRGLKLAVVGIVWALPMIIFVVPVAIGAAISDGGNTGEFFGTLILLCGSCLMFLYGVFIWLVTPGFSIAFATDERINSGLQFTEIWRWTQSNIAQVIITVIVVMIASMVISLVGMTVGAILCLVGLIVTVPLSTLALSIYQYHLYGQLAYNFPYGEQAGLAPLESTELAISPDTEVAETPAPSVEETAPPAAEEAEENIQPDAGVDDSTENGGAEEDSAESSQNGEEDKPA